MGKITYKIDRILSSSTDGLQLGLKTGVALKIDTLGENKPNYLKLTSLAGYQSTPTFSFGVSGAAGPSDWGNFIENNSDYATNDNLIPTVGWVKGLTGIRTGYMLKYLESAYLVNGDHIAITAGTGNGDTTPKKVISLVPLYNGNGEYTTIQGSKVHTVAPVDDAGQAQAHGTDLDNSTKFITGFETDEFGKVTKVYGRKVSTADIGDMTNIDNYRKWGLTVGGVDLGIGSVYGATKTNTTEDYTNNALIIGAGSAIAPTLDATTRVLTFNLQVNGGHFDITAAQQGGTSTLNLKSIQNVAQSVLALYKTKFDEYGRVIESSAATSDDVTALVKTFAAGTAGKVPVKGDGNTVNPENTMYFLNSSANWVQIPYDKVLVSTATGNTHYSLLGVNGYSTSGNYSAATHTSAYIDGDGTIHGTFSGNGSAITNIDASHIVSVSNSLINSDVLNISTLKPKLGLNGLTGVNQVVINTSATGTLSTVANTVTSNTSADGVAVLSANLTSEGAIAETPAIGWRNLKTLITGVVAGEGGMRFMGVIGAGSGETSWASIKTAFKKGDFYKVGTVQTGENWDYSGYASDIEAGDTLIAIKDCDAQYASATAEVKKTYWTVIQSNLINAVTAPNTALSDGTYYLPIANDATMTKIFQSMSVTKADGVWTITGNITHAGDADQLHTSRTLWGQSFNGTQSVAGAMTDVGTITPQTGENNAAASDLGTTTAHWKAAYIDDITGTTFSGTANAADHLVRPLILTFGNTTLTFDGSAVEDAARTFSFDPDALNIFDSIEAGESGSGNVVSGVTIQRKSAEGTDRSVLKYTVTKTNVLSAVSSTLFSISTSNNTATIAAHSSKQNTDVHFYTGTTTPDGSGRLNLNGNLAATKFIVKNTNASSNGESEVASKRGASEVLSSVDVSKKILVQDATSGDYGFIASSVAINNSSWALGNGEATKVPTQAALDTVINNTVTAISASTKVECMAIPFSYVNTSVITNTGWGLPYNSVIDHIDVVIDAAFGNDATFSLSDGESGGTVIISNSEVDLTSQGDVFSYKFGRTAHSVANHIGQTEVRPHVTIVTQTTNGSGTCYIYYTKSQVANNTILSSNQQS